MALTQTMTVRSEVFFDDLLGAGVFWKDAAAVTAMSWLIALSAQLVLPLPWTPVPLTGSTWGVLVAGALLGSRRGPAAVGLYILQGACGLPFFAGGAAGWAILAGPTGGYLLGFLAGAWVTGRLAERGWDRRSWSALTLMLAGSAVILVFGLIGLARFLQSRQLLVSGLVPFIPGDVVKSGLGAAILPWGRRLLGRS